MSTWKTVRSMWLRPLRSAIARARPSGLSTLCWTSRLSGVDATGAGGLDGLLDALARHEAQLDDHVGEEARAGARVARRRDAGRAGLRRGGVLLGDGPQVRGVRAHRGPPPA